MGLICVPWGESLSCGQVVSWGKVVHPRASLPEVGRVCVPQGGLVSCEDSLCLWGESTGFTASLCAVGHLGLGDRLFSARRICVLWGHSVLWV